MIEVSLSDAEKTIEAIWLWYQRASSALHERLLEERTATVPVARPAFLGMSEDEVADFFHELDYLSMLDLLSATEAAIRVDFWTRVQDKAKDPLSRDFRRLVKAHSEKVSLEDHILEAWIRNLPDSKSRIGDFKRTLKLRHWLAHGRYWTPKLARRSYSSSDVFDVCDGLLSRLSLK